MNKHFTLRMFGLFTCLLLLVASIQVGAAQVPGSPEQAAYERRIRQPKLNGRYIPKDLNDALRTLDRLTSEEGREKYASGPEDLVVERLFFSFGRWLALNWSLYEGSRISAYLRDMGIDDPDGQKRFIMRAYHRHLNGQDLNVKDLVARYKVQRARRDSIRRAGQTVLGNLGPVSATDAEKSRN